MRLGRARSKINSAKTNNKGKCPLAAEGSFIERGDDHVKHADLGMLHPPWNLHNLRLNLEVSGGIEPEFSESDIVFSILVPLLIPPWASQIYQSSPTSIAWLWFTV